LTAEPTAQPFAGAACEAGMLKRPKNKAISDAISIRCIELPPSGHPLKTGGVRETKHPTALQSSGHSIRTNDFYNRLSFLNAATEKPGQTPSDRVPQIPPKTRLLWGQVSPSPGPFFWPRRIKEMEFLTGVLVQRLRLRSTRLRRLCSTRLQRLPLRRGRKCSC
jgi:hypothetical protein